MTAPSPKEALEKIIEMNVQYAKDRYGDASKAEDMACVKVARAALATLQPDGERREAIAREIWHRFSPPHHIAWESEPHKGEYIKCADEIISLLRLGWFGPASGLVQDEAAIRADEREKLRNRLDSHLNDFLCGMKEGWDDSVSGFNDAWDVVRKVFDAAAIRSARDGGAET